MVAIGSVVAVLRAKVVSLFQWSVFANLLGHLMGHILADLLCDTSQVRSLSQLYSTGFSQSKISVEKIVFCNHSIKVCVSCF